MFRRLQAWLLRAGALVCYDDRWKQDLDAELGSHLQLHIDDNLRLGMTLEEARRTALLQLGGAQATREAYGARWRTRFVDDFWQDVRHALRMLRSNPAFTVAVIATLTLAIGANTAIFSVVNAVLLKPLPFLDPERVVVFVNTSPSITSAGASPARFNLWKKQANTLQDISAFRFEAVSLTGSTEPEQVTLGRVSAEFFRLFGVRLLQGRALSAEDDRPGAAPVAVLSPAPMATTFRSGPFSHRYDCIAWRQLVRGRRDPWTNVRHSRSKRVCHFRLHPKHIP